MQLRIIGKSLRAAGMWYCMNGRELWEAWAWEAQTEPPAELHQQGWRFRRVA